MTTSLRESSHCTLEFRIAALETMTMTTVKLKFLALSSSFDNPVCASNYSANSYCLVDPDYPLEQIEHAIKYHYHAVASIYKVDTNLYPVIHESR